MALTELADIKAFMGIEPSDTSQDALLTMYKDAIEQGIINYCDSDFTIQTVVNERQDGIRSDAIVLENFPVTEVNAVHLGVDADGTGGIQLSESQYNWDEGTVYLRAIHTPGNRRSVRIDYKWGYASVPADVKMAVYHSIKAMMQRHNKNSEDVSSIRKQDEAQSVGGIGAGGVWDALTGLPKAAVAMLANYRTYEFPSAGMAQRST